MKTPVPMFALLAFALLFSAVAHAQPNVIVWGGDSGESNVPADVTNAVAVASGNSVILAVTSDGRVRAWGRQLYGQTNVPPDLTNAVAVAGGQGHCIALTSDGRVRGWGWNYAGQCDTPANLTNAVAIATWFDHNLALTSDRRVVMWGSAYTNVPSDITNAVGIACGSGHDVALMADGSLRAWGENNWGQTDVPPDVTNVTFIACGQAHTLAIKVTGQLRAWGRNDEGQCNVPNDLTNVVAVFAGSTHTVALQSNGVVRAWGWNGWGQCNVPPLGFVSAVQAHEHNSAALISPAVASPATILKQPFPESQTAVAGSTVHISVTALGYPPLSYQWYFGTNFITGATNKTLVLQNVHVADSGGYSVVVSNGGGATTSVPAVLSVQPGVLLHMVPRITVAGAIGSVYRIDYINQIGPTNAWNPLASIFLVNSPGYFFDESAIGQPKRFYRVVELP